MRRIFTFVGIGCGGLLALVILLGVAGAIIGGGDQETAVEQKEEEAGVEEAEEPKNGKANSKQKQEEEQTVAIGETVEVGDASWTVTNARRADQLNSQFLQPKQGNFVIVDFAFTNNSNEPVTLTPNLWPFWVPVAVNSSQISAPLATSIPPGTYSSSKSTPV